MFHIFKIVLLLFVNFFRNLSIYFFCYLDFTNVFLRFKGFFKGIVNLTRLLDDRVTKPAAAFPSSCVIVSSLAYKFMKRASNKRENAKMGGGCASNMCAAALACMCACKRDYMCICVSVFMCVCEVVALVDAWGGIIATQVFTKRLVVNQLRERVKWERELFSA